MDQDVVHVNGDIAFADEVTEQVIHYRLKGRGGIREAKEHDHGFKEATVHLECGLPLIFIVNSDIVIPPMDIQLCKECRSATVHSHKSIHKLSDKQERGGVSDSEGIQLVIVLDGL